MIKKFETASVVFQDYAYPVVYDFVVCHKVRSDLDEFAPSLTRQEFAEECDINTLMDRYEKTGVAVSHVNRTAPVFMDLAGMPDFREALDILRDATIAFNALPAKVRYTFDNDPRNFVDFAHDPANIDKMREWGLAAPAVVVEPLVVKVEGMPNWPLASEPAAPAAGSEKK